MLSCEIPTTEMLPATVVTIEADADCDFDRAMKLAVAQAEARDNAPRLLGWFDRKSERFSPGDECCVEGEPSWLAFAQAKGADLTIDINKGEYVFVFRMSHGLP